MLKSTKRVTKYIGGALLGLGALAASVLAIVELIDYVRGDEQIEYTDDYIPLVYAEVGQFVQFLNENEGRLVTFKTQISFDDVLGINHLAHDTCDYSEFILAVKSFPHEVENNPIRILRFREPFKLAGDDVPYTYDNEKQAHAYPDEIVENALCLDSVRLKMKDPSSLRFSYGGTGTMSLPLIGTFLIERRFFSGPSIEYTLREQ